MQSERIPQHSNSGTEHNMNPQNSNGTESQASSNTSTSYPSPTNSSNNDQRMSTDSHPAPCFSYAPTSLSLQSSVPQSHLNAPLPSPSCGNTNPFFGRPFTQPSSYHQSPHPHGQPQHQNAPQQHQQMSPNQVKHDGTYPMQQNNFSHQNGSMNQPGALPADFLAEAAKRAQMACLMRDLGDVAL